MRAALIILLLGPIFFLSPGQAQALEDRPTLQKRFAPKAQHGYLHLTATTHIRNDFYDTYGLGLDGGWYLNETLGFEARGLLLKSELSQAAESVREQTGLTPDTFPQTSVLAGGARVSPGYGKILALGRWVLHFDPQLAVHGGITRADTRVLPTLIVSPALLIHFRWGLQLKVDLSFVAQWENRFDRGWVGSLAFAPVVGFGWAFPVGRAR